MRSLYRPLELLLKLSILSLLALLGTAQAAPPRSPSSVADADKTPPTGAASQSSTLLIPGPLDHFLRLAAVSRQANPDEVLPLVSHQVFMDGYNGSLHASAQSEYLVLLKRYVEQARELKAMTGEDGKLRVANCNDAQHLLSVVGYGLRQPCGPHATLQTTDSKRAFTAVDSGFPLAALEKSLQDGKPFVYFYGSSQLPVLFGSDVWMKNDPNKNHKDLLDGLLGDPYLARLYWALAKIDEDTRSALRTSPGIQSLLPLSPLLDYYGEQLRIRNGRVLVPGGPRAESAWEDLVGASPRSPGDFVLRLFTIDNGWVAAYYDALSRVSGGQLAYFTEPHRLARFYQALRGRTTLPKPAGSIFRPDPMLLLLVTRMPLDPNGQPHVPGNLHLWADLIQDQTDSKIGRQWSKRAGRVNDRDQLIASLLALSRTFTPTSPVGAYLALSELDRARGSGPALSPATAQLLIADFSKYKDYYLAFSEFSSLNDESITLFINSAEAIGRIRNPGLRAEAAGIFQAQSGLWQILARQGEIRAADQNTSWQKVLGSFSGVESYAALYDATRTSLAELMRSATGNPHVSQDELIGLVAGPAPANPRRAQARQEIANRIRSILEAQRLVALDSLLTLGDGLPLVSQGKTKAESLIPLAQELRSFEMPKPLFSTTEKITWTAGWVGDAHTQAEMDTNIDASLRTPGPPRDLADARGRIVPFIRDFLTGLNYAYYEPPAAQMLHNNPLFIRRHDFSGDVANGSEAAWSSPRLVGRGETSGGGVRLTGGLVRVPYVLAQVEQVFIVPKNIQALIWEDLVPSMMAGSVLPRWWQVTPRELHAAALYQEFGEDLIVKAGADAALRDKVLTIFADRLLSRSLTELEKALDAGKSSEIVRSVAPAEAFYLAVQFQRQFPAEMAHWGKSGTELQKLIQDAPEETSPEKLAQDFGSPHADLAQTTARELLNLRPFPTFFGYSSSLLAESWESNNLYWARLADEKGLGPESLHQLAPALTRRMAENIFATHLEDWPALVRALRETGDEYREGKIDVSPKASALPVL